MKTENKYEQICKVFAKCMFYGGWQWETPNERVIEMLMREVGLYPFKKEAEMIVKTSVPEELYVKSRNESNS